MLVAAHGGGSLIFDKLRAGLATADFTLAHMRHRDETVNCIVVPKKSDGK